MPAPVWGETFQRLVLALAIDSEVPARVPGAFTAAMFGSPEGRLRSPRQRIAAVVEAYWTEYSQAPGRTIAEELVRREGEGLAQEERRVLLAEWQVLGAVALPDETGFVETQLRDFATYQRFTRTLVQAASLLDRPARDFDEIRQLVGEGLEPLPVEGERDEEQLLAHAPERIQAWAAGDESAGKVPTGLAVLDRVLEGGVRPGEVFYFLAPPKGAKTSFELTVALGAVRRGFNVFFATYEMPARRILFRADRALTRMTKRELREDPQPIDRAVRGFRAAGAGELYVWAPTAQRGSATADVARRLERLRRAGVTLDMVVLDYLNIMARESDDREKRHEMVRISSEIDRFAKHEGVAVWSAALVNRQAVNKKYIHKTDIAEAFEVISVLDGAIAICGDAEMRAAGMRMLFAAAIREGEDEVSCGLYSVDLSRMLVVSAPDLVVASATASDIGSEGEGER